MQPQAEDIIKAIDNPKRFWKAFRNENERIRKKRLRLVKGVSNIKLPAQLSNGDCIRYYDEFFYNPQKCPVCGTLGYIGRNTNEGMEDARVYCKKCNVAFYSRCKSTPSHEGTFRQFLKGVKKDSYMTARGESEALGEGFEEDNHHLRRYTWRFSAALYHIAASFLYAVYDDIMCHIDAYRLSNSYTSLRYRYKGKKKRVHH